MTEILKCEWCKTQEGLIKIKPQLCDHYGGVKTQKHSQAATRDAWSKGNAFHLCPVCLKADIRRNVLLSWNRFAENPLDAEAIHRERTEELRLKRIGMQPK